MSLRDLGLALAARWWLLALCALAGIAGSVIAASRMPRLYSARALVAMELIRPDAETGAFIPNKMIESYVITQARLATSPETAARMVDQFGWLDDSSLQAQYAAQNSGEGTAGMRGWLARRLAGSANVELLPESNLMQLSYVAPDPEAARQLADALRSAYLAEALAQNVSQSRAAAATLEKAVASAERRFEGAVNARAAYARSRGIVVELNPALEAKMRMRAMSVGAPDPLAPRAGSAPTAPIMQKPKMAEAPDADRDGTPDAEQTDADARAAQDANPFGSNGARSMGTDTRLIALDQAVSQAQDAYLRLSGRLITERQEAMADRTNLEPFGEVRGSRAPFFPNYGKIVVLGAGFGLILGIELALLLELWRRRVRAGSQIATSTDTALLATVGPRKRRRLARLWSRSRDVRPATA